MGRILGVLCQETPRYTAEEYRIQLPDQATLDAKADF